MPEHQEGIWIPGARFEANLAADRLTAEILERKHGVRFRQLDKANIRRLRALLDMVAPAMQGEDLPRSFDAIRFVANISASRTLADVKDLEGGKKDLFHVLSLENIQELRELVYTLQEYMEAEAV